MKSNLKHSILLDRYSIDAIARSLFFEVKLKPAFTKIKKDLCVLMLPTLRALNLSKDVKPKKMKKKSYRSQVDRWIGRDQTDLLIRRVNKIAASLYE